MPLQTSSAGSINAPCPSFWLRPHWWLQVRAVVLQHLVTEHFFTFWWSCHSPFASTDRRDRPSGTSHPSCFLFLCLPSYQIIPLTRGVSWKAASPGGRGGWVRLVSSYNQQRQTVSLRDRFRATASSFPWIPLHRGLPLPMARRCRVSSPPLPHPSLKFRYEVALDTEHALVTVSVYIFSYPLCKAANWMVPGSPPLPKYVSSGALSQ